jgi:hypothetical protein
MGFTISNYSLFGLQPQHFYISIHGAYQIRKLPEQIGPYLVVFNIYYSSSKAQPVLTQKEQSFNLQLLPEPANIYTVIYNEIKKSLDPNNILSITDDS